MQVVFQTAVRCDPHLVTLRRTLPLLPLVPIVPRAALPNGRYRHRRLEERQVLRRDLIGGNAQWRAPSLGQSQFVPRGSAAPASEGADSESTQVLTTATGTVLPGTSATSGTAGSGEGPVASSKDLRSPVQ
ncbi:hypothetical protein F444_09252, partial [Phytophthora nicotianae P1976]